MSTERRITDFEQAYFLGIGGIGMSAIARYLLQIGMPVMGYDKTSTPLTEALRAELQRRNDLHIEREGQKA